MRLLDTSAWIEWVSGDRLERPIAPLLPPQDKWLVPTIVQFELSKWIERENLIDLGGRRLIAFSTRCVVVPLTTEIALSAAHFGREHRLAVADAVIYASGQAFDAEIITCDAHFEGLPGVIFIRKS